MAERKYRYVSGDSHLEIDSKHWVPRVPEKYRNRAPRLLRLPDGSDGWAVDNLPPKSASSADLYGGKGRDLYVPYGAKYEGTPGTGSPEQRVKEQDIDGIDAEVLFPSQQGGPKLWRQIKDDEAYKTVVRAYNGWLAEEYCATAPDRLIGMGILPAVQSVEDTIAEMKHCAEIGLKGVLLQGMPSGRSYPSKEDDRFWSAALDLNMPVTVHVDLERAGGRGPLLQYPKPPEGPLAEIGPRGLVEQVSRFGPVRGSGSVPAAQWVLSGLFDRFPNLKIFFAENQIGWIPFFFQQADVRYDRHYHWAQRLLDFRPLRRPPSEVIREHCLWGFQFDRVGVELRHHIGVDHILWGSDFPHQESDWPHSLTILEKNFIGVPEEEKYKMVCGNAVEFFHLGAR